MVTINTKLLGGKISFFQCVCVLGYCIFPIVLAAIAVYILKAVGVEFFLLKLAIAGVSLVWSTMGTQSFYNRLDFLHERDNRIGQEHHRNLPDLPLLLVHRMVCDLHLNAIITITINYHFPRRI